MPGGYPRGNRRPGAWSRLFHESATKPAKWFATERTSPVFRERRLARVDSRPMADGLVLALHFEQMSNAITVRLPEDLAEWLELAARKTGLPKGRIVREQLEKARNSAKRPFLRWAGAVAGPSGLSMRKGFSRK
jgi:predicted DNA binding CopG/RHH family protein